MKINGVFIEDTYAEAFDMRATRVIITGPDETWANHAATAFTGFATSVIGCGVEGGIEQQLPADETPDGRPGVACLLFAVSSKDLGKQVSNRVGQAVLTAPGSAIYSGIAGERQVPMGSQIRFFGDGYQASKVVDGVRYWRVPVMDGEFICQESTGMVSAVGGGNLIFTARSHRQALDAAAAAVAAMKQLAGVIMPFPGGVVRSGSKVGSQYKALMASSNDAYCPTLRGISPKSELTPEVGAVLEIVVNGLTPDHVARAMRAGIEAIAERGADEGVLGITAGNYGGKLGKHHFQLREIMA